MTGCYVEPTNNLYAMHQALLMAAVRYAQAAGGGRRLITIDVNGNRVSSHEDLVVMPVATEERFAE